MMDILKRIDQAQQFCKFYAEGAYSVEKEKWSHHVNPDFIEDIRQYIESLQLKLMHLQTQQAHKTVCADESYDMIDRFLRNNLYDDDYDSYSEALHEVATSPPAQCKPLTDGEIDKLPWGPHEGNPVTFAEGLRDFARAIEAAHGIKEKNT